MKLILTIVFIFIASATNRAAQNTPEFSGNIDFNAGNVEVTVVGSYHFQQIDFDKTPVATNLIALSLMKYKPDHMVVEWLHPSVDPATTFNYKSLGDLETLARLWGYQMPKIKETLETTKLLLEQQKQLKSNLQIISRIRVELGKLYYLNKDKLNAGYQWWRARQSGIDVQDLRRLALDEFKGHELEVLGFEIAGKQNLEYITPFDYQGNEAGSEVWGILIERLRAFAIEKKHGVKESDAEWKTLAEDFDTGRRAFEETRNQSWVKKYGDIKEVREYIAAWEGFDWENSLVPATRDGLSQMRWFQTPQFLAAGRKIHFEIIPGISLNGLGKARTAGNIRRNELMMDFAEADIKRLGSNRVMIIVGYGHKFYLEDLLKKRGYRIIPSIDFMPM